MKEIIEEGWFKLDSGIFRTSDVEYLLIKLLTNKQIRFRVWDSLPEKKLEGKMIKFQKGSWNLMLDNGSIAQPEWNTLEYFDKRKRIFNEVDPYGEEDWGEI